MLRRDARIPNPSLLDQLIEIAKHRAKLIPNELAVGDDRAAVAILLGTIYQMLHQYDLAKGYFCLPLSGPLRSRLAGHRSFAGLGLARVVIASGQPLSSSKSSDSSPRPLGEGPGVRIALLQGKAICEASLKEYPKGSWHDETLYRLATVIQDMAEAKFGKPSVSSPVDDRKPSQPAKPQECDAKAERERLIALAKAKAEALPYWQRIVAQFPNSPRCEQRCTTRARCFTTWQRPCQAASPTRWRRTQTRYSSDFARGIQRVLMSAMPVSVRSTSRWSGSTT